MKNIAAGTWHRQSHIEGAPGKHLTKTLQSARPIMGKDCTCLQGATLPRAGHFSGSPVTRITDMTLNLLRKHQTKQNKQKGTEWQACRAHKETVDRKGGSKGLEQQIHEPVLLSVIKINGERWTILWNRHFGQKGCNGCLNSSETKLPVMYQKKGTGNWCGDVWLYRRSAEKYLEISLPYFLEWNCVRNYMKIKSVVFFPKPKPMF